MLTEASFLAPLTDNAGAPTDQARAAAEAALLDAFGGFTCEAGLSGAWRDARGHVYRDPSCRYVVAAEWTPAARATLARIAERFAHDAGQAAVYLRDDTGAVAFVEPPRLAA